MSSCTEELKQNALYRLDESTRMVHKALEQIEEEEVWKRPNENSNSIGNLILHLCGNITQYAISSLGNQADIRERDAEFAAREGFSKETLLSKLKATVEKAKETIAQAPEEELLRSRGVQGYQYTGIGIIIHVVEHYSYHTGQIAFWVKLLKDRSLGFYDGRNLNLKND